MILALAGRGQDPEELQSNSNFNQINFNQIIITGDQIL